MTDPQLWTRRDIAAALGRSAGTVANWTLRADFPAPTAKAQTTLLYDTAAVRAWWADRQLTGDRWSLTTAAAELGMTRASLKSLHRRGRLPHPDGESDGRVWWQAETLREWAAGYRLPAGAWRVAEARAELGAVASLPPPDGSYALGRWWRPATIRQARQEQLARRWARAAAAAAVRPVRPSPPAGRLFGRDVAELTGLSWNSIRTYRRTGVLPEPDGWHGVRPWWVVETITAWNATRSGGRPRLSTTS